MTKSPLTSPFLRRMCAVLCLLIGWTLTAAAQGQSPQRGFNPGGSYSVSDIETISTSGGNLSLSVPLGGLPAGRGGLGASLNLVYNSKLWDSYTETGYGLGGQPHDETRLKDSPDGGWDYAYKYKLSVDYKHFSTPEDYCSQVIGAGPETVHMAKLMLTLPDGSSHWMRLDGGWEYEDGGGYSSILPDGSGTCASVQGTTDTLTYFSIDGTHLRLEIQHDSVTGWENNPWTLYLPDGGKVTGGNAPQRIYDRNNNYIEIVKTLSDPGYGGHETDRINDQVGRSVILEYGSATNQDTVHVRGANNELVQWHILWTNIQVNKTYQVGYTNHTWPTQQSFRVVTQITLPTQAGSNLAYNFTYNANTADPSYGWGEVSSVTLPSGAKASYQYLHDNANTISAKEVLKNYATRKDLVYRPEYDLTSPVSNTVCGAPGATGCVTETWTYSMAYQNEKPVSCIVTGPDGGVSTEYMNKTETGTVVGDGQVYKSVRPDGTVIERYWVNNTPHTTAALFNLGSMFNPAVKYELTSFKDAQGNFAKTSIKEYSRDKNGNVTQVKEYDWVGYTNVQRTGAGHPDPAYAPWGATLKRVTNSVYNNPTPDASNSTTGDGDAYHRSTAPGVRGAVASTEVSNGTQTLTRTEFTYDNAATTANVTQQKSWDSTLGVSSNPANYVSVSTQYNSYGSPTLSTDARGTQTQLTHGAVNGYTDLYPTTTKAAYGTSLEQVASAEYDYWTGAVKRSTDPNGVVTATTYDAFGRPTLVKAAEGITAKEVRTATDYSDVNRRVIVRSDLTTAGDGKLVSIQHYDQMGRVRLSRRLENSTTESETSETAGVKVQTRYLTSGSNSYGLSSNPYRAQYSHQATNEPSMGWTRSKSDNGGRMVEAQTFGGAALPAPWGANASSSGTVTTAYDAEFTTVTDQAGKVRRSMMNGMGQLARVDEPDKVTGSLGTTASPVQPTAYTYDTLGNLVLVTQDTQTRSFSYSSLSRLTSATNPESGAVSYTYDAGGNLLTKTDARAFTITYVYDALSRNTTVNYSNTTVNPDIERYYDGAAGGKGRFWYQFKHGVNSFDFSAVDGYDAMGRPYQHRQVFNTNGVSSPGFYTLRTYNLAGGVVTQTYPSGHTVNYNYDAAGRLGDNGANLAFTGNLGDGAQRTYSKGIQYDEAGRMSREGFGTQTALYHKRRYNVRGQMWDVRLSTVNDVENWNRGAIQTWYTAQNQTNGGSGTDNNGNIKLGRTYIPDNDAISSSSFIESRYDYDGLNRLKHVEEYLNGVGTVTKQAYDYDRWGNRQINSAATTNTLNEKQYTIDTATNRLGVPGGQLGAMTYDPAGNLTDDSYTGPTGAGARVYDAENRMTSSVIGINSSASYTYDADGKRVRRQTPNENVWQVYGIDGELLAEYGANAAPSTPQKEYGYRNGELLITATANGGGGGGAAAATFIQSDTTTQGSWKGAYGSDGYTLAGDGVSYPAYAQVSLTGHQSYTWAASTTDVRALQKSAQGSTDRIASTWYSATDYTIDLNLTDGQEHQVALYGLDWDQNNGRAMRVEVRDAATNALLGSRDVTAFSGGQYVVWKLRGHVKLKVIYTGPAGLNATVSGLFFDTAQVNVAAASQGATATSSSNYPIGTYTAASTINGDRKGVNWGAGGGWNDATGDAYPDWVQVDFQGSKTITEVDVFTCQDNYANPSEPTEAQTFTLYGLTGFEVQYWTGSAWATVPGGSVTGNNKVWRKFTFAAITTSKIRVLTNAGLASYSRLTEIEAYSTQANDSVQWLVSDHLGTPRMIADLSGSLAGIRRHDYLPFGEEVGEGVGGRTTGQGYSQSDGVRQGFTGHERDGETELDYMQARYYTNAQGRFTSPDSFGGFALNPQTLNLYAYVQNNPVNYNDPTGHMANPLFINPTRCALVGGMGCNGEPMMQAQNGQGQEPQKLPPTTGGIVIQNPCYSSTAGCPRADLGTVTITDLGTVTITDTIDGTISIDIQPRRLVYIEPKPKICHVDIQCMGGTVSPIGPGAVSAIREFILGAFSIIDWSGYPDNNPPSGPFRVLEGAEYEAARNEANKANREIHRNNPDLTGKDIHEMHPVKFGGSPTDPVNKVPLTRAQHVQYNKFWAGILSVVRRR